MDPRPSPDGWMAHESEVPCPAAATARSRRAAPGPRIDGCARKQAFSASSLQLAPPPRNMGWLARSTEQEAVLETCGVDNCQSPRCWWSAVLKAEFVFSRSFCSNFAR